MAEMYGQTSVQLDAVHATSRCRNRVARLPQSDSQFQLWGGLRMSRQPFLFCAGCGKRMPLPVPNPTKTSTDPPLWPTDTWSASVLHLGCGHLSFYTARDLRGQSLARTADPNLSGRELPAGGHEWRRVRLSCAEPHCVARTAVFAYLSSSTARQKLVSTIFGQPKVWRCPAGHPAIYGKAEQQEAYSLEEV